MRSILGAARMLVLRQLRSPLLLAGAALYAMVAGTLPAAGRAETLERARGLASMLAGAGALVLIGVAVVLPLTSVSERRGFSSGGSLGRRGWYGAAALSHILILLTSAAMLGLLAAAIVWLHVGNLDGRGVEATIRPRLLTAPPEPVALSGKTPEYELTMDFPMPKLLPRWDGGGKIAKRSGQAVTVAERLEFVLRLAPTLRIDIRPGSPHISSLRSSLNLQWRVQGGRWQQERLEFHIRRSAADVRIPIQLQGESGRLQIRLNHDAPGKELVFEPGTITLLGARAPFLANFLRTFILLGLAAVSVMAVCLWLSGFVSYPLAVAGTLTVVLVLAVILHEIRTIPFVDPGARLAQGVAIAWSDLAATGLGAASAVLLAILFAAVDPELQRNAP